MIQKPQVSGLRGAAHRAFAYGHFSEARDVFVEVLVHEPGSVEAWNGKAYSELALHNTVDAVRSFTKSLALRPDQPLIRLALASAHLNLSDYVSAETEALAVIERYPIDIDAQHILGVASLRQSRFDDAVTWLSAAVAQRPEDHNLKANLATAAFGSRDLNAAFELFAEVERGSPNLAAPGTLGSMVLLLGRIVTTTAYLVLDAHLTTTAMAVKEQRDFLKSCVLLLLRVGKKSSAADVAAYWARRFKDDDEADYMAGILCGKAYRKAPSTFITSYFDAYADRFDQHLLHELGYGLPELISERLPEVLAGTSKLRVLDAGCGTGLMGGILRPYSAWLEGIDLSPRMLEKASARRVYDALHLDDLVNGITARERSWDVIVALDVFIYIGDLEDVASAARAGMATGGMFIFSIEASLHCNDFLLNDTARFSHALSYISDIFRDGFTQMRAEHTIVRQEGGNPVPGYLLVYRRD